MKAFCKIFSIILSLNLVNNFSFSQVASVKFEVSVPQEGLRKDASIFLAGSFNCWNPHDSSYIMKKTADNFYSLEVPVFEGKKYEYKYTQGDWGSVETAEDGSEIKNREVFSYKDLVVSDTVLKWKSPQPVQKEDTNLKLNPKQLKEFSKLKAGIGKSLEGRIQNLSGMVKKAVVNMLSEKPNIRLRRKYHKEMVSEINRALDAAADVLWKAVSILTPEQKKAMLIKLSDPNNKADIFSMITKIMSQP